MAITPNKAQIEAAGLEYVEPTEIVKDTGPKALNLLAQAVVDIQAKPASIPGDIPIFATLAEAEAWEAANPGRTALTLESSEPDTTAPTAGTLMLTPADTSVLATVSGASDDRRLHATPYAFKVNGGEWSAWQPDPSYTATGLPVSTEATIQHKVRDAAGNETVGVDQRVTTLAEAPWGQLWSDDFSAADGAAVVGRSLPVAPSPTVWEQWSTSTPTITNGQMSDDTPGTTEAYNATLKMAGATVNLGNVPNHVQIDVAWQSGPTHPEGITLQVFGTANPWEAEFLHVAGTGNQGWFKGTQSPTSPPEGHSNAVPGFSSNGPEYGKSHSMTVELTRSGTDRVIMSITVDGVLKTDRADMRLSTAGSYFGVGGSSKNVTVDSWSVRAE